MTYRQLIRYPNPLGRWQAKMRKARDEDGLSAVAKAVLQELLVSTESPDL